jgi:hypothetical protein
MILPSLGLPCSQRVLYKILPNPPFSKEGA